MNPEPMPISEGLIRLWRHVRSRRRWQFVALILLAFAMSFAELLTIGAIVPFVSALVAPEQLFKVSILNSTFHNLGITRPSDLVLPMTISFAALGILSSGMRLLQLYANLRFAYGLGSELSTEMYERTLLQPYAVQVKSNSSDFITGITFKTAALMNNIILAAINLLGSSIVAISVIAGLLWIDARLTLMTFGGLGSVYLAVFVFSRSSIHRMGIAISQESNAVFRVLQEGLGGIRDILLNHNQSVYAESYRKSDYQLRIAQSYSLFVAQAPRYAIEGAAICAVAVVAYSFSTTSGGVANALPTLAALALGAQRLLPIMQQIFNALISIRTHHASLNDAIELLDQPRPSITAPALADRLPFDHVLELRSIKFGFDTSRTSVLNGVTLKVTKGQKVGIIGKTGSGKSTLIDILMCLLEPVEGKMLVDDVEIGPDNRRAWQARLSHVPQSIFLIDGTIADNIALTAAGLPLDAARVRSCASKAHLDQFIASLHKGLDTRVGERGVMLSGGQRQRIGIARALYKDADVIILDEATSALDNKTELEIMSSIEELQSDNKLTFIIVAHRLTTLRSCDTIVELEDGAIARYGTYDQIILKTKEHDTLPNTSPHGSHS